MRVAIHQPHYFPWIGYFDKMVKVDQFILLDEVQLEKGSQMIRNRVLDNQGKIRYLTIMGETKGYLEKKYNDLRTKGNNEWKKRQIHAVENYYRQAQYREEVLEILKGFFVADYPTICEWTCRSIQLICQLLKIKTKITLQSEILYNRNGKKSELVLSLCEAVKAKVYISGNGASAKYLDQKAFQDRNIMIVFQQFMPPAYRQIGSNSFIPGLSILDMLFNLGVEGTRALFWEGYDGWA